MSLLISLDYIKNIWPEGTSSVLYLRDLTVSYVALAMNRLCLRVFWPDNENKQRMDYISRLTTGQIDSHRCW